jgi:hypothetical protein
VELLYNVKSIPILVVLTTLFSLTLLYLCWKFFKNPQNLLKEQATIFPFILASSIAGTIVSVAVLNAHGPLARTALYFFVLLIASLVFMNLPGFKAIVAQLTAVLLSLLSLSLVTLKHVTFWSNHASQPAVYDILIADTNKHMSIGGSSYMDRIFSAEHNIFGSGYATNYVIQRDQFLETDYLLLTQSDIPKWTDDLKMYDLIVNDSVGVSLFRKKQEHERMPLDTVSFHFENGSFEYFGVGSYYVDSTLPTNLAGLEVSMSSVFPKRNADISWVVSFFNYENEHLESRYYRLNQFSRNWNTGKNYSFTLSIPAIPQSAHEMRMYVYNPRMQPHEAVEIQYKIVVNDE